MNKLILGRYFPGESYLHRLDPRLKLVAALYFIGLLFFVENGQGYIWLFLFTFLLMRLSGVSYSVYFKGIRPLIWLILFAVMLRVMFTGGGTIYFSLGPIMISRFGLLSGFYTFSRFIMIILISTIVTLTTKSIDLTDAIHALVKPLRLMRIPVDDFALMLSISLRFVPNLLDETQKVMDAQRARGVVFGEGNLIEQMKKLVPIVLPLFVSSLKRAEEMADVMEVKGYRSGVKRSSFRQLKWHLRDGVAIICIIILTLGVSFFNNINFVLLFNI
ncbi:energy-coupling factor transporter transmembrane component T family protein [Amphibacillus cookii]|uniref:energy-coupling factor transporter transmembrane component T family protein n=1 Tax=Amphibacillus cookii TaxID=767787 RepID=UPI00195D3C7A|nr:energy-coupling factor transporter transmembrane component T [Amphibacillus cookii]MBM7543190.1 energy-coupling factor transport system permease protein [Amphibacillus cookii]